MSEKPSIALVLTHYGWDGRVSGYGTWQNTRCPIHGDHHPSARINEDENAFHCFTCGISGDAYSVVEQAEGCDFLKAKDFIREWTGFDPDSDSNSGPAGIAGGNSRVHERLVNSKLPPWAVKKHRQRLV